VRNDVPRAQEEALHVDLVDPVELLLRDVQHRLVLVRRPGIVDDDMQAAVRRQRELDQVLHVSIPGNVAAAELRVATGLDDSLYRVLAILGVQVVDDDPGALCGKALGNATSEAGACTGHDGDLVLQAHRAFLYPCLITTVLSVVNPCSASNPFSRP
jgi:hypothetical protein